MKKICNLLFALFLFAFSAISTNAATVRDSDGANTANLRSYYDPTDQIFRVGEYAIFGYQIWDCVGDQTCKSPYRIFTVDAVDAAGDKIYCNELGNWLPAYPLTEVDSLGWKSGDQIFRVGEKFILDNSEDHDFDSCNRLAVFKVYNVDAPSDSIQIHLKDKWGTINNVWVYAKPVNEFNTNLC